MSTPAVVQRVLFVCTGNSARSQIAEALLRPIGGDRSAGTHPRAALHPMAVRTLEEQGIDIRSRVPKGIEALASQSFDYVITLCDRAREACPTFPEGEPIVWSFPDPAAVEGEAEQAKAFRQTAVELRRRVELLAAMSQRSARP